MCTYEIQPYAQYNEEDIVALYQSVGWLSCIKDTARLQKGYGASLLVLAAYHEQKLVGILRAMGDGETILYIQDIIVLPAYQHQGIGSALVNQALQQYAHVYQKVLLTDNQPNTVAFYQALGFLKDSDVGCVAFVQYHHC